MLRQVANTPSVQVALTVSAPEARTHEDSKDKHAKHIFEIDSEKFRVLLTGTTHEVPGVWVMKETDRNVLLVTELQIARAMMETVPTMEGQQE